MKLTKYRKTLTEPLKQVTLCLLVKDDEILLAMKKRGFGKGRWNGVGGKPEQGETIEEALLRETQEEIEVTPTSYHQVATLDFYFPSQLDIDVQVHVFLVDESEHHDIYSGGLGKIKFLLIRCGPVIYIGFQWF